MSIRQAIREMLLNSGDRSTEIWLSKPPGPWTARMVAEVARSVWSGRDIHIELKHDDPPSVTVRPGKSIGSPATLKKPGQPKQKSRYYLQDRYQDSGWEDRWLMTK